ncbi:hypothetical protein HS141_16195 [Cetobacterium somerae]|uniref:hypothetical protein n=1 Tax=Cetobacterium somerae TaxID=188913 RepID=UPI00211E1E01|nr:hypothetical protein [Cetobacterium somerae]MCQ9628460.1 hypothetical protein [Cetobacterium somerae]
MINENMSFEDIFKVLTNNGYTFIKETFLQETCKIVKTEYKELPKENCWLYHPNENNAILFTQKEGIKKMVKWINEWIIYIGRANENNNNNSFSN